MSDGRERRSLTSRQEEIAHLLPYFSYRQIGDQLGLAERTIKYHVDVMRYRYGVKNKLELIQALRAEYVLE